MKDGGRGGGGMKSGARGYLKFPGGVDRFGSACCGWGKGRGLEEERNPAGVTVKLRGGGTVNGTVSNSRKKPGGGDNEARGRRDCPRDCQELVSPTYIPTKHSLLAFAPESPTKYCKAGSMPKDACVGREPQTTTIKPARSQTSRLQRTHVFKSLPPPPPPKNSPLNSTPSLQLAGQQLPPSLKLL